MASGEDNSPGRELTEITDNLRLLAENVSDVLWIRSGDLRTLYYVSPAFQRIWGRPQSELQGDPRRWIEFVAPCDRARVQAAFNAFVEGDGALDIEYDIHRPDGESRRIRVRGFKARDAAGVAVRLVGIVSDITDQRRAERALRESEAQMRVRTAALDAAANAVVITGPDGVMQWANTAFTRLTGYDLPEVIGQNIRLLKSGRNAPSVYRLMWETITRGEVWRGEVVNRRKDGRLYHEEMTITPVTDATGAIGQFIAIKEDITERKRTEAEIQDLHQKLVRASRRSGEANVATEVLHNAGNVLNSINVSVNLLSEHLQRSERGRLAKVAALLAPHSDDAAAFLRDDPVGRKIPEYLQAVAEALAAEQAALSGELASLRQNITHLSGIIARQQRLADAASITESLVITDLLEDALRSTADALTGDKVEIVRDYEAQPRVSTDRYRVSQILVNLVRNARQACAASGRADQRMTVAVKEQGDRTRVEISDNGIGIAETDLTLIFGPVLPQRRSGPGAGLHADANAAAELGGSLSARSNGLGHGATFVLELPSVPRG